MFLRMLMGEAELNGGVNTQVTAIIPMLCNGCFFDAVMAIFLGVTAVNEHYRSI